MRFFFSEEIPKVILQVPISKFGGEDFASWPYDTGGIYSVRSAYNLARTEKFHQARCKLNKGGCSDVQNQENSWKSIWTINCPNKMKIVLWHGP